MRLIDADEWWEYFYDHMDDQQMMMAKNALDDMPTIEAEKIIRCKECKWKYGSCCVRFAEVYISPDDYCSRGERRKNANN